MRSLRFVFGAASLVVITAFASPTDPKPGAEYTVLSTPQPSQTAGKKVEVIEFFMYHCPYCHALEPVLEQWVTKQGNNIIFKRIHMPYQGPSDPEAHLFLTLQAMGKNEEYQAEIMDAVGDIVRRKRSETLTEQEVLDVASRLPGIVSKNYRVESVPTIIVDGKYVTSPAQVGETVRGQNQQQVFNETLQVVDALITKVQKSK
jgi:thiol:disulfide interchange protein DsbA